MSVTSSVGNKLCEGVFHRSERSWSLKIAQNGDLEGLNLTSQNSAVRCSTGLGLFALP